MPCRTTRCRAAADAPRAAKFGQGHTIMLLLLAPCLLAQRPVVGVPKTEWAQYDGDSFSCRDGSGTVPMAKLNDEYCDCADGSDEPGTSACAGADSRFYCPNRGFRPLYVRSSVVNDGVCDCCDGSDEHSSGAGCPSNCIEAGIR